MSEGESHPLYILVYFFIFALVAVVMVYFLSIFLTNFPNPFAVGSVGNAIYQNGIIGKTAFTNGFSIIEYSMLFIGIAALFIDVLASYFAPDKGRGIINIILVFVMPFIWLVMQAGLKQLSFLTVGTGITPIIYTLFTSVYFITVATFMLAISTIFNFRHNDEIDRMPTNGYENIYRERASRGDYG